MNNYKILKINIFFNENILASALFIIKKIYILKVLKIDLKKISFNEIELDMLKIKDLYFQTFNNSINIIYINL